MHSKNSKKGRSEFGLIPLWVDPPFPQFLSLKSLVCSFVLLFFRSFVGLFVCSMFVRSLVRSFVPMFLRRFFVVSWVSLSLRLSFSRSLVCLFFLSLFFSIGCSEKWTPAILISFFRTLSRERFILVYCGSWNREKRKNRLIVYADNV